jgi:flagellar assembly protein FliH
MSSSRTSRIIKSGQAHVGSVQCFCFSSIVTGASDQDGFIAGASGFVPFVLGAEPVSAAPVSHVVEPVELPSAIPDLEGMVVLSEEELQAKVDEVFRNGMEEGRRQAERGLANVFKSLRDGVSALTGLRSRVFRESEEDLLKLAVMIARKIVQQEIAQDRGVISSIVSAAIGGCTERDRVVVRLNPDDYAVVAANRQAFLSGLGEDAHVTLTPDEGVGPGGCLVEAATGTVDARIEAQLDEIYRTLLEERSAPVEAALPVPADLEPRGELHQGGEEVIPPFKGVGTWVKGEGDKADDDV